MLLVLYKKSFDIGQGDERLGQKVDVQPYKWDGSQRRRMTVNDMVFELPKKLIIVHFQ